MLAHGPALVREAAAAPGESSRGRLLSLTKGAPQLGERRKLSPTRFRRLHAPDAAPALWRVSDRGPLLPSRTSTSERYSSIVAEPGELHGGPGSIGIRRGGALERGRRKKESSRALGRAPRFRARGAATSPRAGVPGGRGREPAEQRPGGKAGTGAGRPPGRARAALQQGATPARDLSPAPSPERGDGDPAPGLAPTELKRSRRGSRQPLGPVTGWGALPSPVRRRGDSFVGRSERPPPPARGAEPALIPEPSNPHDRFPRPVGTEGTSRSEKPTARGPAHRRAASQGGFGRGRRDQTAAPPRLAPPRPPPAA